MMIKICCPGCRRNFTLKTANPASLNGASFRCPKCGMSTPFSVFLSRGAAGAPGGPRPMQPGMAPGMAPGMGPGMAPGAPRPMGAMAPGAATPVSPGTHMGGPAPGAARFNGGTQVNHTPSLMSYLLVKSTGKRFTLSPGEHVLGRDSADSRATLRIAPDPYMSRAHALLSVTPTRGGAARVTITGMNATNVVYVNNARLYPGSQLELHPGDEILLGMTTVKYIVS